MSIGSFISRQIKFAEAAVITLAAGSLNAHVGDLETLVATDAPLAAGAIVSAVEKADKALGPAESALINSTINAYSTEIDTEVAGLLSGVNAQLEQKVGIVVAAMQAVAAKLQTEALASK